MTLAEYIAIATAAGTGIGGGITLAARLMAAVLRELATGSKEIVAAIKDQTAAVAELRTELATVRTRVDTLLDLRPSRPETPREEPSSVRGPFPLRPRKEPA